MYIAITSFIDRWLKVEQAAKEGGMGKDGQGAENQVVPSSGDPVYAR